VAGVAVWALADRRCLAGLAFGDRGQTRDGGWLRRAAWGVPAVTRVPGRSPLAAGQLPGSPSGGRVIAWRSRYRPRQQAVRRTAATARPLSAICPWPADWSNMWPRVPQPARSARTC